MNMKIKKEKHLTAANNFNKVHLMNNDVDLTLGLTQDVKLRAAQYDGKKYVFIF